MLNTDAHLDRTFAALADPTRRAMLGRLSRGEASVGDLARPFLAKMSLPAVTRHLQVLERAGLVTKTRDAQWRPCRLNGAPLREAVDWMEQYRAFFEESLDRLGDYLKSIQAAPSAPEPVEKNQPPKRRSNRKATTGKAGRPNRKTSRPTPRPTKGKRDARTR